MSREICAKVPKEIWPKLPLIPLEEAGEQSLEHFPVTMNRL